VNANESEAHNRVVSRKLYSKQIFMAIAISILMVGSSFLVVIVGATTAPQVKTDYTEYFPGQQVVITGQGFLQGSVTITISHPEITTVVDTCLVGQSGSFVYDKYYAEGVEQKSVPVDVLAYQDDNHKAST